MCPRPCRRRGCSWHADRDCFEPGRKRMVVRGSACRAAICTSRRSTPTSSIVVTKVCRSMCGCMCGSRTTDALARTRSRRVAQCRSIRRPRELSRIGPGSRSAIARSIPRPTAGGSGINTILEPLPTTRRTRWPCSSPTSAMSVLQASKIRNPSITTKAKSNRLAESRAADSSASNCRCERPSVGDSFETRGRRTYSAGECARTPSMTHVR